MARFTLGSRQAERVQLGGKWYFVCAECRLPMQVGHTTVYDVPIPGKGLPDMSDPDQALCDICYRAQYLRMYPKFAQPHVHGPEYHPLPGAEPIPWDRSDYKPPAKTDIELFEEALALAKATGMNPDIVLRDLREKNTEVTVV